MNPIRRHDIKVASEFAAILEKGGNGHDYLEFASCGPYRANNRAARIARQVWRDRATDFENGHEPYYTKILCKLNHRVDTFYAVDPGDVAPTAELTRLNKVNN